jgi:ABC-type multidrug transport system fused ATPase/permease subunit
VLAPFRPAFATLSRGTLALLFALSALRLAERAFLIVVVVVGFGGARLAAAAFAAATAALVLVRTVLLGTTRRRVHEELVIGMLRSLLEADVLQTRVLEGDDAQRVTFEGAALGERLVAEQVPEACGDAVAAVAALLVLAVIEPPAVVATLVVALVVTASAMLVFRRYAARAAEESDAAYLPVIEAIVVGTHARLELAASGHAARFLERARSTLATFRERSRRAAVQSAWAARAPLALGALALAAVLVSSPAFGVALSPVLFRDAAVVLACAAPAIGVARAASELVRGAVRFRRVNDLLTLAARDERRDGAAPPRGAEVLAGDALGFRYGGASGGPFVFRGVHFAWRRHEMVVVRGRNGAGKTTLLRLLLALAPPTEGTIALDGRDVRTFDADAYRRTVAYLPQRPYLPERLSIGAAMRLVCEGAGDEALLSALARVELLAPLRARGGGAPLDVPLAALSVGERQRVALARVLAQDVETVLLDEPDANLDAAGVAMVRSVVRELARSKRVVVVAHSAALIEEADRLLDLDAHARGGDA